MSSSTIYLHAGQPTATNVQLVSAGSQNISATLSVNDAKDVTSDFVVATGGSAVVEFNVNDQPNVFSGQVLIEDVPEVQFTLASNDAVDTADVSAEIAAPPAPPTTVYLTFPQAPANNVQISSGVPPPAPPITITLSVNDAVDTASFEITEGAPSNLTLNVQDAVDTASFNMGYSSGVTVYLITNDAVDTAAFAMHAPNPILLDTHDGDDFIPEPIMERWRRARERFRPDQQEQPAQNVVALSRRTKVIMRRKQPQRMPRYILRQKETA